MSKFEIKEINDFEMWNEFVDLSPQGTIFAKSYYLKSSGREFQLLGAYKGIHLKAGVVVVFTEDKLGCELDDLIIYGGILFCNDETQKEVKSRSARFQLSELFIEELDKRFNKVELAFAPQLEDMRPFLWHNYHSSDANEKFDVDLRYTSCLNIEEFATEKNEEDYQLFKELDTLRQRNIRDARRSGVEVVEGKETLLLIKFYESLMLNHDHNVEHEKLKRMQRLTDSLLEQEKATMFLAKDKNGEIMYVTVFCFDNKKAYYLFGAGNPDIDTRYRGTMAFWEAFRLLAKNHSISEVDLEGVNSPQRGSFKLSFGGDLKPYYQIYKGRIQELRV